MNVFCHSSRFSLVFTLVFALTFSAIFAGAEAVDPASILLRQMVDVNGDTLRLSDLFPRDAPATLRAVAAGIELGRAPQPGSLRVLESSQITRRLQQSPKLMRRLLVPAQVTVRRVGWPISRIAMWKAVASFLQNKNEKKSKLLDATDLQWEGGVSTGAEDAAVEVTASHWDSRRQSLALRMRCVDSSFCGSFLAFVPGEKTGFAGVEMAKLAVSQRNSGEASRAAQVAESSHRGRWHPLAEAGRPAKLMVEGDGFRISLPVVCLQRGMLGQKIRALDSSSHRVIWGEVVGTDRLLAIF